MSTRVLGSAILAAVLATTGQVRADDAPVAPTSASPATALPTAPSPQEAAAAMPPGDAMQPMQDKPTPQPASAEETARWQRAHFSGGRWAVEMLGGAVLGTLAAYGTYTAAGEGTGGTFAGIAAGFVVTPLVEWGIGRAMGGQGKLLTTYMGGLLGFSLSTPATAGSDTLIFVIAQIMCPITSGLFFEFSSNMRARDWQMQHGLTMTLAPVGTNHVDGAAVTAAMRW